MREFYRSSISWVLSLYLALGGCASQQRAMPQAKPGAETAKAFANDSLNLRDSTTDLVKRVVSLAKEKFSQAYKGHSGILYIGSSTQGHEYIAIEVMEKNGIESLLISSYVGWDPNLEAVIPSLMESGDYKGAKEALNKSGLSVIGIYDDGCDGLKLNTGDLLGVRNVEGQVLTFGEVQFSEYFAKSKKAYKLFLERALAALERLEN